VSAGTPALAGLRGVVVVGRSLVVHDGVQCALVETDVGRALALLSSGPVPAGFEGRHSAVQGGSLFLGPLSAANARALRARLPWLVARPIGLRGSIGLGDRLGLATPGHIRALRAAGAPLAPIFAQQSMRELARTGSEAQDVVDAATWGAFEEGWRDAHGADADHLKTAADVDRCLAAGFTFFTIDPGDHVQGGADTMAAAHLEDAVRALPWEHLRDSRRDLVTRYAGRPVELGDRALRPSQEEVLRAAAKYGARFVTGATIPVDGGFSAYSGV
jgi:hypothetical protein